MLLFFGVCKVLDLSRSTVTQEIDLRSSLGVSCGIPLNDLFCTDHKSSIIYAMFKSVFNFLKYMMLTITSEDKMSTFLQLLKQSYFKYDKHKMSAQVLNGKSQFLKHDAAYKNIVVIYKADTSTKQIDLFKENFFELCVMKPVDEVMKNKTVNNVKVDLIQDTSQTHFAFLLKDLLKNILILFHEDLLNNLNFFHEDFLNNLNFFHEDLLNTSLNMFHENLPSVLLNLFHQDSLSHILNFYHENLLPSFIHLFVKYLIECDTIKNLSDTHFSTLYTISDTIKENLFVKYLLEGYSATKNLSAQLTHFSALCTRSDTLKQNMFVKYLLKGYKKNLSDQPILFGALCTRSDIMKENLVVKYLLEGYTKNLSAQAIHFSALCTRSDTMKQNLIVKYLLEGYSTTKTLSAQITHVGALCTRSDTIKKNLVVEYLLEGYTKNLSAPLTHCNALCTISNSVKQNLFVKCLLESYTKNLLAQLMHYSASCTILITVEQDMAKQLLEKVTGESFSTSNGVIKFFIDYLLFHINKHRYNKETGVCFENSIENVDLHPFEYISEDFIVNDENGFLISSLKKQCYSIDKEMFALMGLINHRDIQCKESIETIFQQTAKLKLNLICPNLVLLMKDLKFVVLGKLFTIYDHSMLEFFIMDHALSKKEFSLVLSEIFGSFSTLLENLKKKYNEIKISVNTAKHVKWLSKGGNIKCYILTNSNIEDEIVTTISVLNKIKFHLTMFTDYDEKNFNFYMSSTSLSHNPSSLPWDCSPVPLIECDMFKILLFNNSQNVKISIISKEKFSEIILNMKAINKYCKAYYIYFPLNKEVHSYCMEFLVPPYKHERRKDIEHFHGNLFKSNILLKTRKESLKVLLTNSIGSHKSIDDSIPMKFKLDTYMSTMVLKQSSMKKYSSHFLLQNLSPILILGLKDYNKDQDKNFNHTKKNSMEKIDGSQLSDTSEKNEIIFTMKVNTGAYHDKTPVENKILEDQKNITEGKFEAFSGMIEEVCTQKSIPQAMEKLLTLYVRFNQEYVQICSELTKYGFSFLGPTTKYVIMSNMPMEGRQYQQYTIDDWTHMGKVQRMKLDYAFQY